METPKTIDYRVSQRELSVLLGISTTTILAWVRKGYIPAPKRVNHMTLYSLAGVKAGIETNRLRIKPPQPLAL